MGEKMKTNKCLRSKSGWSRRSSAALGSEEGKVLALLMKGVKFKFCWEEMQAIVKGSFEK